MLSAAADVGAPPAVRVRRALLEVVGATLVVAAVIALFERLAAMSAWISTIAATAVALAFLVVPLLVGRLRGLSGDPLGLHSDRLAAAGALGLAATLVVAAPFVLGFDVLQVSVRGLARGNGPGLRDHPAVFSGRPARSSGRVIVASDGSALTIYNGLAEPITITPACDPASCADCGALCAAVRLPPGGRRALAEPASDRFVIADSGGKPLSSEQIGTGAGRVHPDGQPLQAPRGYGWLWLALLTQVLVVALPEEVFFRGYVQRRLRAVLPPRRTVMGVPFGAAHVLSALLFALIHLVALPAPSRLLVFFPGLLFAWLAERSDGVVAPTVHHALSNLMLRIAQRFYA